MALVAGISFIALTLLARTRPHETADPTDDRSIDR
jgi:hypothetical protein